MTRENRELVAKMRKEARGLGQYLRAVPEIETTNMLEVLEKMKAECGGLMARMKINDESLGQYVRAVPESEGTNITEPLEKMMARYRDPNDPRPVVISKIP